MQLSDEELRRRMAAQQWTAHNLRFTPAVTSLPGRPDFMETDLRLRAILRALSFVYRGRLAGLRAADLGCLEGGYALALAQRGVDVVGVEAREKNFEKLRLVKEHFALPNLAFRRDDVKNFTGENYGTFNVVLALGILYHLDNPVAWLRQLAEATEEVLVVESHFAPPDESSLARLDPSLKYLGPIEQIADKGTVYTGRWFFEYGPEADRESQLWASYSNRSSFWLTKESLLKAVVRAGFDLVLEQHDYSVDSYELLHTTRARGMYLALKTGPTKRTGSGARTAR
ncbi:MAG TPA: methyltransferase domain-containing protein [Pyrinomonadaceae bacterium]|nr:methyltransferase domain-containing protein [Pyrinomonadaceae bacterium]